MIKSTDDMRALEDLVDRNSLNEVVDALAEICEGKAERLEPDAAGLWRQAMQILTRAAAKIFHDLRI
jgi:hypothetical protein